MNLLASGASESEIFIWDLNNLAKPMSPGNKTYPQEDITGLAWNRQVCGGRVPPEGVEHCLCPVAWLRAASGTSRAQAAVASESCMEYTFH